MDGHQRKREETSQAADISSSDRTNDRGSSRRANSSQMPFSSMWLTRSRAMTVTSLLVFSCCEMLLLTWFLQLTFFFLLPWWSNSTTNCMKVIHYPPERSTWGLSAMTQRVLQKQMTETITNCGFAYFSNS